MKKLTDFLRKRPLLWFALTLALSIIIVILLAMYDRGKTTPSNDFISRNIENYKDKIGAGGIYIVKDGRVFPYGEIFLRKNLFRIRGR